MRGRRKGVEGERIEREGEALWVRYNTEVKGELVERERTEVRGADGRGEDRKGRGDIGGRVEYRGERKVLARRKNTGVKGEALRMRKGTGMRRL